MTFQLPTRSIKPASFETIPAEVRNQIYFLTESLVPTLHHPKHNAFVPIDNKPIPSHWQQNLARVQHGRIIFDTSGKYLPQPAITRVCRKLRKETLVIYYGNAKFYITRFWGFQSGEMSREYITRWIEVQCQRLCLRGSILFSPDFDGILVVKARRVLGKGVVCGPFVTLKPKKVVKKEGDEGVAGPDQAVEEDEDGWTEDDDGGDDEEPEDGSEEAERDWWSRKTKKQLQVPLPEQSELSRLTTKQEIDVKVKSDSPPAATTISMLW